MVSRTVSALLTLLSIVSHASPIEKRQDALDCGTTTSCVTYSGTSIWFEPQTGSSCPTITRPAEVALPTVTQRENPASCYYPTSLDYCAMGQAELMTAMSSVAVGIYNAQPEGAVVCGSTKTANMPVITPRPPGKSKGTVSSLRVSLICW